MKKTLLFVFAANLFFAQNSELISTNWQVTKVAGELFPADQLPPPMPFQQITDFSTNPSRLTLSFFNSISADVTYSGQNTFMVNSKACTLGDYMDDSGQVNQFFGLLCNFFTKDANYYYTIANNGTEKTLIVSNSTFQELHFKSGNLSTKNVEASKTVLGPNPVKSVLNIHNSDEITSVNIYDFSGKSVLNKQGEKSKNISVDMRNLKAGTYIIKVNNNESYKVIKE